MNELLRQTYLDAMGVDNYYPRIFLSGAKASVLCEMPLPDKQSVPVPPVARKISELFDEGATTKSRPIKTLQPITQVVESIRDVPHFSLSIVRAIEGGPLVIDEALGVESSQQDYFQLLHNLLFALGFGKQQLVLEDFRWPLIKQGRVKPVAADQSETAARQTLEAFVNRQLSQSSHPYILLMGNTAAHYFSETHWEAGQLITYSPTSTPLIHTVSVAAMLNSSELKRQAWQQLQPLVQLLRSHAVTEN